MAQIRNYRNILLLLAVFWTLYFAVYLLRSTAFYEDVTDPKALILYPIRYLTLILVGFFIMGEGRLGLAKTSWKMYLIGFALTFGLSFAGAMINVIIDNQINSNWLVKKEPAYTALQHLVIAVIFAPIVEEIHLFQEPAWLV